MVNVSSFEREIAQIFKASNKYNERYKAWNIKKIQICRNLYVRPCDI